MWNVKDLNLSDFSTQEKSFIDVIFKHAHIRFFMRNAQNQGQTSSMTDSEIFVLRDWEHHIC